MALISVLLLVRTVQELPFGVRFFCGVFRLHVQTKQIAGASVILTSAGALDGCVSSSSLGNFAQTAERIVADGVSVQDRLHTDAGVIKAVFLFAFVYAIERSDIPGIISTRALRAMEKLTIAAAAFAFVALFTF